MRTEKSNSNANPPAGDSKAIVTNQDGLHDRLADIVNKHLSHSFQKPFQQHTLAVFEQLDRLVKAHNGEVILDACCGIGQSTRLIAKQNPRALVIGVDKSDHRINRNVNQHLPEDVTGVDNFHLVRADLNDFYRLVKQANWPITKHYILYPNPWPKSKHVQRRWHGSAVFPDIIAIGEQLILRSNWLLYLQEFQFAAELTGKTGVLNEVNVTTPLTPFEAKFSASGQVCWQLVIHSTKA